MRILKVISLLLDYPDQHLRDGHAELAQAIGSAREISPEQRIALRRLLDELTEGDLMDVQERYTDLFDRGRALSLLLFEHVHGESRDRGQAMVDLMAQYTEAGFAIGVRELPDYIPLYLEYLATREDLEAREGLADVAHLLALLAARLQERESPHAACFTALLQIAGEPVQETLAGLQEQVAAARAPIEATRAVVPGGDGAGRDGRSGGVASRPEPLSPERGSDRWPGAWALLGGGRALVPAVVAEAVAQLEADAAALVLAELVELAAVGGAGDQLPARVDAQGQLGIDARRALPAVEGFVALHAERGLQVQASVLPERQVGRRHRRDAGVAVRAVIAVARVVREALPLGLQAQVDHRALVADHGVAPVGQHRAAAVVVAVVVEPGVQADPVAQRRLPQRVERERQARQECVFHAVADAPVTRQPDACLGVPQMRLADGYLRLCLRPAACLCGQNSAPTRTPRRSACGTARPSGAYAPWRSR